MLPAKRTESRVSAIVQGGKPLAFIQQQGAFVIVGYPYRKTRDMYLSLKGADHIHCCNCTPGVDIPMPKRGPSRAGERRFTRHILSHHRRSRTLLPWLDSLKTLEGVIKRVVWEDDAVREGSTVA